MQGLPKLALLGSACGALFASAGVAQAQGAQPSGEAAEMISEVLVTAERRSTNLQETPVAVTAISAEQLAARGVQSVRGLESLVPSLSIGSQTNGPGANSATFWIRGLGQIRAGNGSEPSVPLYIDDFYYPGIAGNVLRAMDIEQVEVLRGPQGTLFGRNSTGGAIRYTTRKPSQEFGGYVEGAYGSYDRSDVIGGINVPLGEKVAVRLTAASMETDGYVRHVVDDGQGGATENTLLRGQVRFMPTDSLTFDLSYEESDSTSRGSTAYIPTIAGTGQLAARWNARPANTPKYTQAFASPCVYCTYGGLPVDNRADTDTDHLRLVAHWQVNDQLDLKLLSGRTRIKDSWTNDVDGTPANVVRQYGGSRVESLSHELQALGDMIDALHYVVGVYYYREDLDASGGQILPNAAGVVGESRSFYTNRRESISGYANVTFDVTERLSVTGGVRVGSEKIRIHTLNLLPATGASDTGRLKEDMVLPLARVQYDWSDDIMTYASVSRGFRAGGFNIVPANADAIPFESEEVTSYEAGARMEFLDRRVRFNPTAFYTDYDQMQINRQYTPPPPAPPAPTSILENAGRAHILGVELESDVAVTRDLRLRLAASYMDGEFDELKPGVGVTLASPLPRLPKWFYSVGAQYTVELNGGGRLAANLDYAWRSRYFGSASNVDAVEIPSYGLLNGQVEYRAPDARWSLAVFGTNLADKEYVTGGLNLLGLVGNVRFDMGRPRELGIRLRIQY